MKKLSLISFLFVCMNVLGQNNMIGRWTEDTLGLPCFEYTGAVPVVTTLPTGEKANVPEDPWFLLGNYQLTLFIHVSGEYELMTGQRAWARMNQKATPDGVIPNSGENAAKMEILNEKGETKETLRLTGLDGLAADPKSCKRLFGCGFASYLFNTKTLEIERKMEVAPSRQLNSGESAFILTVSIKNKSNKAVTLNYNESVLANYRQTQYQRQASMPIHFVRDISQKGNIVKAEFRAMTDDSLMLPPKEETSVYDAYPPSLFLCNLNEGTLSSDETGNLLSTDRLTIPAKSKKTLRFVIGYAFDGDEEMLAMVNSLKTKHIGNEWFDVLPVLEEETDKNLRQELRWHAYNLEAMATYSRLYGETKIPQGTIYDYDWGQHASARDNFQHSMPLIYYNPELAKSSMRYMAQRTTPYGDIRLIEYGSGFAETLPYCTSDQQLFYFQLLSEYLRVTEDYAFFDETTDCYPKGSGARCTILETTEHCFKYLKDVIARGPHGLIRLLNSDWNDNVFVLNKVVYNDVIYTAESHLNSAMAIAILDNLSASIEIYATQVSSASSKIKAENLAVSMRKYRKEVLDAFFADLSDRSFTRRMYFEGKAVGDDNMYIEPQGYMLQIKELNDDRKRMLYDEMVKRIYDNEKLGARQQQQPEKEGYGLEKGSRENGGMWYSMNGPIIAGLATFDRDEAMRRLRQLSFDNYAHQFPDYWTSYWSASDNIESSLLPTEGLADQSLNYHTIPVFCAHPHAWILYCYFYCSAMHK